MWGKLPRLEEEGWTPLQVILPEDRGSLMSERPRVQPSFVALCGVRATAEKKIAEKIAETPRREILITISGLLSLCALVQGVI